MYNEEENIWEFYYQLKEVLDSIDITWELICVNDGSKDQTLYLLHQVKEQDHRVKIISLSRNFGKEGALTAGMNYAKGSAIIPMDADLQDPPFLVREMVDKWRDGYDVVHAVRKDRSGESWLRKKVSEMFYRTFRKMSSIPIEENVGDFRLLSRRVVDIVNQLPESRRFMKGLFSWAGFSQAKVYYDRPERFAGTTKWNYWKLWNFAIEGLTAFSFKPLQVSLYVGVGLVSIGLVMAILLLLSLIWAGTINVIQIMLSGFLFLGGLQFIFIGFLGEYIGRLYDEVKHRPAYIVDYWSEEGGQYNG